jgi:hypothetical protein
MKYIKSRQWSVTYYLLLLFGAIVGFDKALPKYMDMDVELLLLAFGVGCIGMFFQYDFQRRLQDYRQRNTNEVVRNMSAEFREYEKKISQRRKGYESFFEGFEFTMIFVLILWMGVSLVHAYLYGADVEKMIAIAFVPPVLFLLFCFLKYWGRDGS